MHYFAIRFGSLTLKIMSAVSLLLSNSTTGLLILFAYYTYTYQNKLKPKILYYPIYFVLAAAMSYLLILNLGTLTGRGGGASYSALSRFAILYAALTNLASLLFGWGMGTATSQAVLYGYDHAFIADNTYIGVLYNAGIVPAALMLAFVLLCFDVFTNKLLALVFLGYSMTTVFFEISPVVQLMLVLLGSSIGRRHSVLAKEYPAIALRNGCGLAVRFRLRRVKEGSGGPFSVSKRVAPPDRHRLPIAVNEK
jgi:hypothetical protein